MHHPVHNIDDGDDYDIDEIARLETKYDNNYSSCDVYTRRRGGTAQVEFS